MLIGARTRTVWLLGAPVVHSHSPRLHNAVYQHYGWDWVYLAAEVQQADLGLTLAGLKRLGFVGANITVPHKQVILEHLDEITPGALALGAVNTVAHREGRLIGHNTDGQGWLDSWDHHFGENLEGRRVVLLGAGGAARAVYQALLARRPGEIWVLNRTVERAEQMVKDLGGAGRPGALQSFASLLVPGAVVIQTTSAGLRGELPVEFPPSCPVDWVGCELSYGKPTPFLTEAAATGARTMDGLGMLIYQAGRAIEVWSGIRPEPELMWKAEGQS